ncbi:hypothetical protein ACFWPH_25060 [Nocardia sp. NPDC058499]|uniref:hypothetical protein n=1 Tax=Nocardia sp. NPDC058499 TaxID=3346530 RepID=UPI00365FF8FB
MPGHSTRAGDCAGALNVLNGYCPHMCWNAIWARPGSSQRPTPPMLLREDIIVFLH